MSAVLTTPVRQQADPTQRVAQLGLLGVLALLLVFLAAPLATILLKSLEDAEGRFVGLLTPENVGEFFMIRRALANRPPVPPRLPPVIAVPPVISGLRPSRPGTT